MENILMQILEGQKQIIDRLEKLETLPETVDNLQSDVLAVRKDTNTIKREVLAIKKDLRYAWEDIQKLDKRTTDTVAK